TYGVPMLVLPVLNDQPINAVQVTALKIGKRLNFLRVSAKELSAEAFGILSDDEIQRQCLVIQKKLQFSMKSSDAAAAVEKYLSKKTSIN
ncbi:MAG: glycosyltransferase, partial [Enterococcus sp.]